ncbi:uncharacterized protein LOC136089446 [Hydra vulgaris]|uniref:Uncharacterized protein LOC136089446 n=1 Tax=Hydra vulgaris TaxID=6087 RepID=A0ABM4DAY0_HYDVU
MEFIQKKKINFLYAYFKIWLFIIVTLTCETLDLLNDGESLIPKNNIAAILPLLEKTYSVLFKLKPILFATEYTNVIHLTTGIDYGEYGGRTPAIFFTNDGSGRLYICSAVNLYTGPYPLFVSEPLPLNKWSSIRLMQFQNNGKYTFVVFINEVNVYSINNQNPQSFQNVKVYISNPWHKVQDGFIKDLRIINGNRVISSISNQVIKMSSKWVYKQPSGTLLQTQNYQFVCRRLQLRQQSPCYQQEILSGIVTFLPIQVMDIIGYDSNTALIYGITKRNNFIEVNLNKKKAIVISSEKCSSVKVCNQPFDAK